LIRPGIHLAETEAERRAVYRFRYDVYVEEMGRYAGVADHENRLLVEPEDDSGRIFYAAREGEVVGTSRLSWGGDGPFSERQIRQYRLGAFLHEVPLEAMAVGERGMVVKHLRGSELFSQLQTFSQEFTSEQRIQLVFGACEPHLLSLYLGQGARTYAKENINSADAGYLIPIVFVPEDVAHLRAIGSPEAERAKDFGADARVPACVERLITKSGNVLSHRLTAPGAYWQEVHGSLAEIADNQLSALDGLSELDAERLLGKSNIIECRAGDRLFKKGGVARNMFVVLDGTLEVRDGDTLLRVLGPGDVLGEIAFLLERPRSADVYAATDGVRVLSLSEGELEGRLSPGGPRAANDRAPPRRRPGGPSSGRRCPGAAPALRRPRRADGGRALPELG
jgi:hypothetical protein